MYKLKKKRAIGLIITKKLVRFFIIYIRNMTFKKYKSKEIVLMKWLMLYASEQLTLLILIQMILPAIQIIQSQVFLILHN